MSTPGSVEHQTPSAQAQVAYAPTNGMAVFALVSALLGLGVFGLIFGNLALKEITRSGERGRGIATVAVVIGWIHVGFWIVALILLNLYLRGGWPQ